MKMNLSKWLIRELKVGIALTAKYHKKAPLIGQGLGELRTAPRRLPLPNTTDVEATVVSRRHVEGKF